MYTLTLQQIKEWLAHNGLSITEGTLQENEYKLISTYRIPEDSGRKTALAKIIAEFFKKDTEVLLWINEYGIWPTSEDVNLFLGFRKSLGENSMLYEKPGHLFSGDEIATIVSLLAIVFYFIWGAVIVSVKNKFMIKISHDEIIAIFALEPNTLTEECKILDKLKGK